MAKYYLTKIYKDKETGETKICTVDFGKDNESPKIIDQHVIKNKVVVSYKSKTTGETKDYVYYYKSKKMTPEEAVEYYTDLYPEASWTYDEERKLVISSDNRIGSLSKKRGLVYSRKNKHTAQKTFNPNNILLEEGEVLVDIPKSEYKATSHGKIYNKYGERIGTTNNNGYLRVSLTIDGIHYNTTVQRVICLAFGKMTLNDFKDYSSNRLDVDHYDNCRTNNHIDNLQVISHSDNIRKRDNNGAPMAGRTGARHARSKPVLQYSLDGELIAEFESGNLAAKELGLQQSSIANCCNGKPGYKTHKGFIWRYKGDEN